MPNFPPDYCKDQHFFDVLRFIRPILGNCQFQEKFFGKVAPRSLQ
ncbi:hypothetical protein N0824_00236 [Microcystis sp. 0824]|nr:hypothetical protein N0824_00236 [Microcystis sp. 0824]